MLFQTNCDWLISATRNPEKSMMSGEIWAREVEVAKMFSFVILISDRPNLCSEVTCNVLYWYWHHYHCKLCAFVTLTDFFGGMFKEQQKPQILDALKAFYASVDGMDTFTLIVEYIGTCRCILCDIQTHPLLGTRMKNVPIHWWPHPRLLRSTEGVHRGNTHYEVSRERKTIIS